MTAVNDAIVKQTCANIASELVCATKPETLEDALKSFKEAYDEVVVIVTAKIYNTLSGGDWDVAPLKGGRDIPIRKGQQEVQQELDIARSSTAVSTGQIASSKPIVGGKKIPEVTIVGASHGDIPAWLPRACAKAGITRVFDNRDGATPENRRPLFVSADGNKTPFWAPKNMTSADIGLDF
jgi:hypothetical protein